MITLHAGLATIVIAAENAVVCRAALLEPLRPHPLLLAKA
jgi:hypothetical protein